MIQLKEVIEYELKKLLLHSDELIRYMRDNSYSEGYIRLLKTEINWLRKNWDSVDSYESACKYRERQTSSPEMQRRYRLEYGILKRFDIDGVFPDFRKKEPLVKRGAYYQLDQEFREVIDLYRNADLLRGLKLLTVKGNASAGACFLYAMQKGGISRLSEINEEAAMSFFTDPSGDVVLSNGYRKQISLVFKADLAQYTCDARRILAYLHGQDPGAKTLSIYSLKKRNAYTKPWIRIRCPCFLYGIKQSEPCCSSQDCGPVILRV